MVKVMWPNLNFEAPSDISGTAKARIMHACKLYQSIAFGWQYTPKMAWSGSRDPFSVSTPAISSPKWLKRESPNSVCRWNMSSASLLMIDYPLTGVVSVTWPDPFLKRILSLIIFMELVKLDISNFVCWLMHRSTGTCIYQKGYVQSHVTSLNFGK